MRLAHRRYHTSLVISSSRKYKAFPDVLGGENKKGATLSSRGCLPLQLHRSDYFDLKFARSTPSWLSTDPFNHNASERYFRYNKRNHYAVPMQPEKETFPDVLMRYAVERSAPGLRQFWQMSSTNPPFRPPI